MILQTSFFLFLAHSSGALAHVCEPWSGPERILSSTLCPARGIVSVLLKYQSLFVCFKKRKNETQIKHIKGDNST